MPVNVAAIRLVIRALRYRHKLDRLEIARMIHVLHSGDTCIDIGAHKGAYTYWMARRVGHTGRVFAFEPQQRLAGPLARTFASMHWSQVRVIEKAVSSASAANVPMFVRQVSTHGASLIRNQGPDAETVPVTVTSIDDFAAGNAVSRVDFIKIDAEALELSILEGAHQTLDKFRPTVLAEIETRHHERAGHAHAADPIEDVLKMLAPMGYACEFPYNGQWRPVEDFGAATHQNYGHGEYVNNFLFTARN